MKRILSFFTLVFIFFTAKAETSSATSFAGGDGTSANPYQISNLAELRLFMESSQYWNDTLELTASIDASETETWDGGNGFTAIGTSAIPFIGYLDGNLDSITGLHGIDGLFGYIEDSYIHDLFVTNATIAGGSNSSFIIAKSAGTTLVERCGASGTISNGGRAGGIVASVTAGGTTTINECFVDNATMSGSDRIGGINAVSYSSTVIIKNCYSNATISGESSGRIAGIIADVNGSVINCYSYGTTTRSEMSIKGYNGGTISRCYYKNGTDPDGTRLTADQFADESNFTNWDFLDVWTVTTIEGINSSTRPYLQFMVTDKYKVTFQDYDNTKLLVEFVEENSAATAPSDPERTGYTFSGWDVDYSNITSEITVTAQYTINSYDVTFKDYDGSVLKTESVDYSSAATAPSDPSRTGYTFTGWNIVFTSITADTTITAQYTINSYDVTFKDYDGSVLKTESVDYSSAATAPSDPSRTGYTFTGWDVDYSNITSDITVTAQYTINSYDVTFKDYDGSVLKTESVDYSSAATAPSDPSRTGYTFTGWNIVFTNITADTTITAQYTINSYDVTFKDYDGSVLKTESVDYSAAATAPSDPKRTGYTFTGWNMDFTNITSDTTVTAQYELLYAVVFNDYDGTKIGIDSVTYGSAATAPSAPERTGYTFTGWNMDFSNITSDTTVTAQYTIITYAVIFKDFDGSVLKTDSVDYASAATAPSDPERTGYTFSGWDIDFSNITSDTTVTAQYTAINNTSVNRSSIVSTKVYPNPASSFITIENGTGEQVIIYSLSGKIVKQFALVATNQTIEINDLQQGIYFIKVGEHTQKISIQK